MKDKLKLVPNFVYNNALPISIAGVGGSVLYDATFSAVKRRLVRKGYNASVPVKYINNESNSQVETPYSTPTRKRKVINKLINSAPVILPITTAAILGGRNTLKVLSKPGVRNQLRSKSVFEVIPYLNKELLKNDPRNIVGKASSIALGSSALGKFLYNRSNVDKIKSDRYYAIRYTDDEIIILREFNDKNLAYQYKGRNPGVRINKGSTLIDKGFNKGNKEG